MSRKKLVFNIVENFNKDFYENPTFFNNGFPLVPRGNRFSPLVYTRIDEKHKRA